jgi:hypothetical protein
VTVEELRRALEAELRVAHFHAGGFNFSVACGRADRIARLAFEAGEGVVADDGKTHLGSMGHIVALLLAEWWFDGAIEQRPVPAGAGRQAFWFTEPSAAELVAKHRVQRRLFPAEMPPQLEHEMKLYFVTSAGRQLP